MRFKLALLICLFSLGMSAQKAPANWFNLDPEKDNVWGVGSDRAYSELLKGKASKTIIVAVIDSGVDIEHEDLKNIIWTNKGEIAGNGIDDDKNGYVDDVHGWNFIGGKGKQVTKDNLELTRLYRNLKPRFDGKKVEEISKKDKKDYDFYKELKDKFNEESKKWGAQKAQISGFADAYHKAVAAIKKVNGNKEITLDGLSGIDAKNDPDMAKHLNIIQIAFSNFGESEKAVEATLEEYLEYMTNQTDFYLNLDFNSRKEIVADNYDDPTERFYGNNDVRSESNEHGTHVAGIIGAIRDNGKGMNGVANNILIMPIRVVPDGDERDKDVANGIRYAVDNGAKVVNMSFGKPYSPYKKQVDEAVKYAEKKGVLLVHGAGNDALDVDVKNVYPNKKYGDKPKKVAKNWINVGAISWKAAPDQYADFSNYGQKFVDIFAPGVDIYATVKDSQYKDLSGTSMASPVVAGCAALLWSYFPSLKCTEVKDILMKTAKALPAPSVRPGGDKSDTVSLDEICVTGGVVNVYEAIKMAQAKTK